MLVVLSSLTTPVFPSAQAPSSADFSHERNPNTEINAEVNSKHVTVFDSVTCNEMLA
jgi:hypothetical protein